MARNQKLIVAVVAARDLVPKDGHGTSSPYVMVDFYWQRKLTHTAIRDLNPTWNEVLEFNVGNASSVFANMLEPDVYHDKNHGSTTRNNFLGIRLSSSQFVQKGEEALIYYPLQKKQLFGWIHGDIGLKIYYQDKVVSPPPPPPPEGEKAGSKTNPAPAAASAEPEMKVQDDVANRTATEPPAPPEQPPADDTKPNETAQQQKVNAATSPSPPPSDTASSPIEEEKPEELNIPSPPPPASPPPQQQPTEARQEYPPPPPLQPQT